MLALGNYYYGIGHKMAMMLCMLSVTDRCEPCVP